MRVCKHPTTDSLAPLCSLPNPPLGIGVHASHAYASRVRFKPRQRRQVSFRESFRLAWHSLYPEGMAQPVAFSPCEEIFGVVWFGFWYGLVGVPDNTPPKAKSSEPTTPLSARHDAAVAGPRRVVAKASAAPLHREHAELH